MAKKLHLFWKASLNKSSFTWLQEKGHILRNYGGKGPQFLNAYTLETRNIWKNIFEQKLLNYYSD